MNRLTKLDKNGVYRHVGEVDNGYKDYAILNLELARILAEYENTGLTPAQIKRPKTKNEKDKEIDYLKSLIEQKDRELGSMAPEVNEAYSAVIDYLFNEMTENCYYTSKHRGNICNLIIDMYRAFNKVRMSKKHKLQGGITMNNKKIGPYDIAKTIKDLMTMANFSGYINQDDGEMLRQFGVSSIIGNQDAATLLFDIAEQGFKLDISRNPDYKKDGEPDAE